MNISFFHQAHLNNWRSFQASLHGEGTGKTWDIVVLTAASERQAAAYQYQLTCRHELGMLPENTVFHVIADPPGSRVGSAGATLNVLRQLFPGGGNGTASDVSAEAFFAEQRILILHSGGDSKRLPQHSAFGKIFAPIPRLLASGRPSTLFDELFVALSGLPEVMSPGVVIASGDVLLLFDHSQLNLVRPGFTGIAIAAPLETATHHGVYIPGRQGRVDGFFHKPSASTLRQFSKAAADDQFSVDTGIVYFGAECAALLQQQSSGPDSWLGQAMSNGAALNFYGEVLLPLAPNETLDAYLADESDGVATPALRKIRREMWDALRGSPFYVETVSPAKFLHFGTTREYQRLLTYDDQDVRALGGRRRISHVLAPTVAVSEHACILHSSIAEKSVIEDGAIVEFSAIGPDCHIADDSIVSGLDLPGGVCVPPAAVVHGLTIRIPGTESVRQVIRVWGIDDNPKAALPEATWFGKPLADWMAESGLTDADLWESDTPPAGRTLWAARLYPAADSVAAAWQCTEWLFTNRAAGKGALPAPPAEWRRQTRFSLQSSSECADLQAVGAWRQKLFAHLVLAKCRGFFDEEKPVAQWFEKIPTARDLEELLSVMDKTAEGIMPDLKRLRWYYAISELAKLASLPAEQSARKSRHYAELAFHTLAGCIAAAKLEHATARKVDSWQRPEVSLELPVRIDLAGGWSDTPPFTLEKGGTVLNAAVALNAEFPLVVSVRRLAEPVVRLESADLAMSRVCTSMKQLSEYTDPRDPLAIHKAAFVLACVPDKCGLTLPGLCEKLGGGVCISSDVRLPKGTGLGVSSILAAGLVKGLYLAGANAGEEPSLTELFDAASLVEQMLTTGGGWQDQVGGLFPGLKLTTSAPGEYQRLSVAPITLSKKLAAQFDDRLLVLDTGQRRLAKNLLREIMGKWLAREPRTVSILHDIQRIARDMAEALAAGDFSAAGTLMWRHWELNKQLDEQTSNEFIDQLMISLRPYVEGAKLAGAGGGGFMMGIMKPGAREKIADMLATEYAGTNVKLYPAHVCWDI